MSHEQTDLLQTATTLGRHVEQLWGEGWQPSDVVGAVRRFLTSRHVSLASAAIRAGAVGYRHATYADQNWLAQVDDLPGDDLVVDNSGVTWLAAWAGFHRLPTPAVMGLAFDLLSFFASVPRLHPLGEPPSRWNSASASVAAKGLEPKVLAKVRALLAKAESTTFPEEADALTAKAQELIARHSIDRMLLAARDRRNRVDEPRAVRVWIDNAYADAKYSLLEQVASASRCQAVWMNIGCSTVFGMEADLQAVDLLFTSLLVQATHAMVEVGKGNGRYRGRYFRRSFLTAFALRIGQRLREATAEVVTASASADDTLLPVLASQQEQVEAAVAEAFPKLRSRRVWVADHAGWAAGAHAADQASLAPGGALPETA